MVQCGILIEALVESCVIDAFGMQLLVNPLFEAHLTDSFDVAGTRAVSQPIERVQSGLVCGELGDWQAAFEFLIERYRGESC